MRLIDANLLLYARFRRFPQHERAHSWLDDRLNGVEPVGLPWASLLAFVRLASNRRFFEEPLSISAAWQQVQEWLDQPTAWIPQPGDRHREIIGPLLAGSGLKANDVPDAHLAALAVEHGVILCSADAGFGRFRGLRWENPLQD